MTALAFALQLFWAAQKPGQTSRRHAYVVTRKLPDGSREERIIGR